MSIWSHFELPALLLFERPRAKRNPLAFIEFADARKCRPPRSQTSPPNCNVNHLITSIECCSVLKSATEPLLVLHEDKDTPQRVLEVRYTRQRSKLRLGRKRRNSIKQGVLPALRRSGPGHRTAETKDTTDRRNLALISSARLFQSLWRLGVTRLTDIPFFR